MNIERDYGMSFNMVNIRFPYCAILSRHNCWLRALRQNTAEGSPRVQLEEHRKAGIYERYSAARMQTSINNSISSLSAVREA